MKKKSLAVIAAVAFVMMFMPADHSNAKANPLRVTYYTVKYACIVSPDMRGTVQGEWTLWCDGSMTGWGWEPGHNCTYTETTYGVLCGGGGGGGEGNPCPCKP
jgi:hypothetical protein